jgi:hypothetical protein
LTGSQPRPATKLLGRLELGEVIDGGDHSQRSDEADGLRKYSPLRLWFGKSVCQKSEESGDEARPEGVATYCHD